MWEKLACSVIPLVGGVDVTAGKRPAATWLPYQRRRPTSAEVARWFGDGRRSAFGVVCGSVSGLIVLDVDDPALAVAVIQEFPDLLDTLVVESGVRGTPHIYWRVDFPVKSRSFTGGDLKAEGGYVVGPGSRIGDAVWMVVHERPVRKLTAEELARVLAFVGCAAAEDAPVEPAQAGMQRQAGDYVNLYRYFVSKLQSRNQALFHTACTVRDAGHGESWAVALLADVYAETLPCDGGRMESYRCRRAEALRTIRSAFSRPARRAAVVEVGEPVSRCPNSIREALLCRADGAAVARVLEGAVISGLMPGGLFTEAELCRRLAGMVSRETIRKALRACFSDNQPIFPPCTPPAAADTNVSVRRQKNAFLSPGQKQTKRFYALPDSARLCAGLGVKASPGDAVTRGDVSSAKSYRQALHRAFIGRRPGMYSQALLGARLSVSARTIRRYNGHVDINSQATYHETPITWANLDDLPPAADVERYHLNTGGSFLLDDSGKRWPVRREIAAQLLARGRRVSHMRQGVNYYWCGPLPRPDTEAAEQTDAMPLVQPMFDFVAGLPVSVGAPTPAAASAPVAERAEIAREGASTPFSSDSGVRSHKTPEKPLSKRYFRKPLPDAQAERLAQRVRIITGNMSIYNARRLVHTYGHDPVKGSLNKMSWLYSKGRVDNPAAFLITAARISWRVANGADDPQCSAPRFQAEPPRRPRRSTYKAPPDHPLWKSPAYRQWRASFFGLDDPYLAPFEMELPF